MAIEYHEGLPGAGKSYEAVVFHIIPAIKERRTVVSNIRGLNVEQIAQLAGQPVDLVRLLIINIEPAEQDSADGEVQRCVNEMCDQTPDNALIVWDEIQDYFPSGNYKLPLNQQKFWTEHRHRGLDIIVMGQDRTDCHKLIRNRIRTVIYFLKLEAVGRPDSYKWEIYQKQKLGKFVKTGSGTRNYESKYFGTYASVRRETVKKRVYQTDRTNLLANSKSLVWGVPAAFLAAIFAINHLWGFFHPKPSTPAASVQVQPLVNPPPPEQVPAPPVASQDQPPAQADPALANPAPKPIDYLDTLAQQYQIRAAGIMVSQASDPRPGKDILGQIELLDSSYHVKESFSVSEIRALGWTVTFEGYGLLLTKQGVSYVARAWPIDVYGRVDGHTEKALGAAAAAGAAGGQGVSTSRQTLVVGLSTNKRNLVTE